MMQQVNRIMHLFLVRTFSIFTRIFFSDIHVQWQDIRFLRKNSRVLLFAKLSLESSEGRWVCVKSMYIFVCLFAECSVNSANRINANLCSFIIIFRKHFVRYLAFGFQCKRFQFLFLFLVKFSFSFVCITELKSNRNERRGR